MTKNVFQGDLTDTSGKSFCFRETIIVLQEPKLNKTVPSKSCRAVLVRFCFLALQCKAQICVVNEIWTLQGSIALSNFDTSDAII